jgi:hypothetical protein
VFPSLPLMMSSCSPAASAKILGTNSLLPGVPLPRQETVLSSNPLVTGMSQIIAGLPGSLSILTKKELDPLLGASTTAFTT